jgi:pyranose oxidase
MGSDAPKSALIVGSGPVGAVYARLLVDGGWTVTMLEAGAVLSDPPGDHLANAFVFQRQPNLFMDVTAAGFERYSVPQKILRNLRYRYRRNYENPKQRFFRNMMFASAVYGVGGMSTIWTAACPPHEDFELSPLIPLAEWRRLLAVADGMLSVSDTTFADAPLAPILMARVARGRHARSYHNLRVAAQVRRNAQTGKRMVRWSSTSTILGPLLADPAICDHRFTLLAQYRAERLLHDGTRVSGVLARDLSSDTCSEHRADVYIVAGGSFCTPRLLWQSDIRPRALGHYLFDHTQAGCRVVLKKSVLQALRNDPNNPARHDPFPLAPDAPQPMLSLEPTPERPWHAQIHGSGRKFLILTSQDVRRVVDMSFYGMVTPRFENHISFDETLLDRFGQPQITIHFRWSRSDIWQMLRMWWDMRRTAHKIGRIKGFPLVSPPGTTLHLMGTYRMGAEHQREESVVDTHGKVWDFDNLYLGGLGVIENPNASNPTNVACALAVRAVERILGRSLDVEGASPREEGSTPSQPAPAGPAL